jgi:hypothetical protein
MKLF